MLMTDDHTFMLHMMAGIYPLEEYLRSRPSAQDSPVDVRSATNLSLPSPQLPEDLHHARYGALSRPLHNMSILVLQRFYTLCCRGCERPKMDANAATGGKRPFKHTLLLQVLQQLQSRSWGPTDNLASAAFIKGLEPQLRAESAPAAR